jgi:glutamate synthase domain-containing protein 1
VNCPPYRPEPERDACGAGFVADIAGRPSHRILEMALTAVTNLAQRALLGGGRMTITGSEETCPLPTS